MFCEFCGQQIPGGAAFCPECGARVNKPAAQNAAPPAPAKQNSQPQYTAPAQPATPAPQYGAPRPFETPRYQAPAQPGYQQPYQQQVSYTAPRRVSGMSQTGFLVSVVLAAAAAVVQIAYFVAMLVVMLPQAKYYQMYDMGNAFYYTIGQTAFVLLCYCAFAVLCLRLRSGSPLPTAIPALLSLLPLLISMASWIFDFEVFGVQNSFETEDVIAAVLAILGYAMYFIVLALKLKGSVRFLAGGLLLGCAGFQVYFFVDVVSSVFKYQPSFWSAVGSLAGPLASILLPVAMTAVLLGTQYSEK